MVRTKWSIWDAHRRHCPIINGGIDLLFRNSQCWISYLRRQCQRQVARLAQRPQLFSYSREQFHPPPNVSGVVDVADLEVALLLVDFLTLKHENTELRWLNERLEREKKVLKSKVALYELTNKYFQPTSDVLVGPDQELVQREKTLRLYVSRLYRLLELTTEQLQDRQAYYEHLFDQIKTRNRELVRRIEQSNAS